MRQTRALRSRIPTIPVVQVRRSRGGRTAKRCGFCENYLRYVDNEEAMPFDQHYLLACVAPRRVLIGSASEDHWADPISEQLACAAASNAFTHGFAGPDRPAQIGETYFGGDIGYHLRRGTHFFSREDWLKLIRFVRVRTEAAR